MTRRAFTLIEMLTTMFVILILVGLVLPAMPKSLGAATRVSCQANLRSIGQAMAMYLSDGDGLLPFAYRDPDVAEGERQPWASLARYIDAPLPGVDAVYGGAATSAPWLCPSDDTVGPTTGFSYHYGPTGLFGALLTRRQTSRFFLSDGRGVIAVDAGSWHPGASVHQSKNALMSDGSAGKYSGVLFTVR